MPGMTLVLQLCLPNGMVGLMVQTAEVVLVNPPYQRNSSGRFSFSENLALGYLSSYLKIHGISTRIIDCDLDAYNNKELIEEILGSDPVLVGITALARTADYAAQVAREILVLTDSVHVVLGGQHFHYAASGVLEFLDSPRAYVIQGEGEIPILKLVEQLKLDTTRLDRVPGLVYRSDDGPVFNPPMPPFSNLDELPFPDRSVARRAVRMGITPSLPVLGSRGCYSPCVFCNAQKIYNESGGAGWRGRSPENIVNELEELNAEFDELVEPVFLFYDDTFIGPGRRGIKRAHAFADRLRHHGVDIKYEAFIRANSICEDESLVRRLAESGLVRAFVGIESGDDAELALFKKCISTEQIKAAFHFLKRHGVSTPSSGFIMFHPYSSIDSLRRNAEFLRSLGQASIWNLSVVLDVYAGNATVEMLRRDGLIEGSTAFGGCFDYRFTHPRVGRIAEFMNINDFPEIQRLDSVTRFVQYDAVTLYAELRRSGFEMESAVVQKVDAVMEAVNEKAYRFFLQAITAFENEDGAGANRLKEEFLSEIDRLVDALIDQYSDFMEHVAQRLESAA
jgi:anaerobic magnesium-protoporphyrin IX monomethyl ester cyclase